MTAPDSAPEPMRYGILGHDPSSTGQKLEKFTGPTTWKYLRPHFQSGVLYFVDPNLPLAKVGTAFAENNTAQVEAWLKTGDLVKIEPLHAAQWETTDTPFEALVVSPFVLCRPSKR
jgi:hypothetical protein